MKGVIITSDGAAREVTFDNDSCYATLRDAVGGYIECVALSDTLNMWVNEEGKLINLPPNFVATQLWSAVFGPTDIIVGDAIFTGGADDDGNTLGLTDSQVERLLALSSAV